MKAKIFLWERLSSRDSSGASGSRLKSRSHQWSDIAEGDGAMQESARLQIP